MAHIGRSPVGAGSDSARVFVVTPTPKDLKHDPPRRFVRAPVAVEAWVLEGGTRIAVSTTDLSSSGVRLSMPAAPWRPRARLDVVLRLASDRLAPRELALRCAVIWCSDKELGAEFTGVDEDARELIDALVDTALAEAQGFAEALTPLAAHALSAEPPSEEGAP